MAPQCGGRRVWSAAVMKILDSTKRSWARALAAQKEDAGLAQEFAPVAKLLSDNEAKIVGELAAAQGPKMDIGGYYSPDPVKAAAAMRPSATLNGIIDAL